MKKDLSFWKFRLKSAPQYAIELFHAGTKLGKGEKKKLQRQKQEARAAPKNTKRKNIS